MLQVFGVDFTSAPSQRKPITCARCWLDGVTLHVETVEEIQHFAGFEALLDHPGEWIAGMDFPFGQPRRLVENLDWPLSWQSYVQEIARMDKSEFVDLLVRYASSRPPGDRHHLRETDKRAQACSPMMVYGVPVGRMFFEGARRLLASGVHVAPNRPTNSARIAVEVYPALLARFLGQRRYKGRKASESKSKHRRAREAIMHALRGAEVRSRYGIRVDLGHHLPPALVEDDQGDLLDAVLCSVQAAWAWRNRNRGFGVSTDCDALEGWICDPSLLTALLD